MTEAQAKFIMGEIHRISVYESLLHEYDKQLKAIRQKLDDLQSLPSSGNYDKVKAENNHVEVSTKINSYLSDEQVYIEQKAKVKERMQIAISYKKQVIAQTESDPFIVDYINRMSYRRLTVVHGYENPYEHMIVVMKGLSIRI
jgi:phage gp36-like protein